MANSTSSSISTPPSGFKDDKLIPEHYFANIVIFFIIFIAIAMTVGKFLKSKFPSLFQLKVDDSLLSVVKHSQKLSATTKIHFVKYQDTTILITESTSNVCVQLLPPTVDYVQTKSSQETSDLINNLEMK